MTMTIAYNFTSRKGTSLSVPVLQDHEVRSSSSQVVLGVVHIFFNLRKIQNPTGLSEGFPPHFSNREDRDTL